MTSLHLVFVGERRYSHTPAVKPASADDHSPPLTVYSLLSTSYSQLEGVKLLFFVFLYTCTTYQNKTQFQLNFKNNNHNNKSQIKLKKIIYIPSVLKPNLDLLGLDVGENRTFSDELLAAHRTWFRTIMIKSFKSFNLFRCISNILPVVHLHLVVAVHVLAARTHRHHCVTADNQKQHQI